MEEIGLLSDEALLAGVEQTVGMARQVLVRLLAYLGEIEDRRLELRRGYSSLFDFCTTKLRMSPGEAQRRIVACRLVRRFPIVLALLETGAVNITGLELLRPHLDDENHRELLAEASFKKKEEILELLARRFPRPDVPETVRKLPVRRRQTPAAAASSESLRLVPPRPLAPDRYAVTFTASAELRDKLEHAKNLMSHANPSLELAAVVERALDLLIADLEKRKLGKASRPRKARATQHGAVTQAARRAATNRDGTRCAWVDEQSGRRCSARAFLEADHVIAKALGGSGDAGNVRWLCHAHNQLHAEQTFGREAVEQAIDFRQRRSGRSSEADSKVFAGLTTLGFRHKEARVAVEKASSKIRARNENASPEHVLREALLLLSDAHSPNMNGHMAGLAAS